VLVLAFNPVEAFLYASVAILPLFLVLFHFLEQSQFKHKTLLVAGFAMAMIATNVSFLY
jgi:hypothetical protein